MWTEHRENLEDEQMLAICGPGARMIEFAVGPHGVGWTPAPTPDEASLIIEYLARSRDEGSLGS